MYIKSVTSGLNALLKSALCNNVKLEVKQVHFNGYILIFLCHALKNTLILMC